MDYVKSKGYMFTVEKYGANSFSELQNILTEKYKKMDTSNSNCPDLYLNNKSAEKFLKKNLDFSFEESDSHFLKMNDLNIDEEICDTSVIFNKKIPDKIRLRTKLDKIDNIMILASKKNKSGAVINLEINFEDKSIENEKIILKKYPFWTKLILKKKYNISEIKLDVSDLKKKTYGISEIKIYSN